MSDTDLVPVFDSPEDVVLMVSYRERDGQLRPMARRATHRDLQQAWKAATGEARVVSAVVSENWNRLAKSTLPRTPSGREMTWEDVRAALDDYLSTLKLLSGETGTLVEFLTLRSAVVKLHARVDSQSNVQSDYALLAETLGFKEPPVVDELLKVIRDGQPVVLREIQKELTNARMEIDTAADVLYHTGATRGSLLTRAKYAKERHQELCEEAAAAEEQLDQLRKALRSLADGESPIEALDE